MELSGQPHVQAVLRNVPFSVVLRDAFRSSFTVVHVSKGRGHSRDLYTWFCKRLTLLERLSVC